MSLRKAIELIPCARKIGPAKSAIPLRGTQRFLRFTPCEACIPCVKQTLFVI